MIVLTDAQVARFWSKIDKSGDNGCWNWTGWANTTGHGRFDVGRQKPLATHVAMELAGHTRPPPPYDNVLHGDLCTPRCCNPSHLRWGTKAENTEDRDRLGRRTPLRGEAHGGHKITEDVVRAIRASGESQRALAKRFGISTTWVAKLKRRQFWAHVT